MSGRRCTCVEHGLTPQVNERGVCKVCSGYVAEVWQRYTTSEGTQYVPAPPERVGVTAQ